MKIKNKLIKLYNKLKNFFPSPTPQGITEFNAWAQSIIDTYNPPMDERSVKFTLCALLMRTGADQAYVPKRYFAKCIHRGAASQVGAYVMEEIKKQQAEEYAASEAAAKLEATSKEASNDKILPNGQI